MVILGIFLQKKIVQGSFELQGKEDAVGYSM